MKSRISQTLRHPKVKQIDSSKVCEHILQQKSNESHGISLMKVWKYQRLERWTTKLSLCKNWKFLSYDIVLHYFSTKRAKSLSRCKQLVRFYKLANHLGKKNHRYSKHLKVGLNTSFRFILAKEINSTLQCMVVGVNLVSTVWVKINSHCMGLSWSHKADSKRVCEHCSAKIQLFSLMKNIVK